jgi:hypothetical protein
VRRSLCRAVRRVASASTATATQTRRSAQSEQRQQHRPSKPRCLCQPERRHGRVELWSPVRRSLCRAVRRVACHSLPQPRKRASPRDLSSGSSIGQASRVASTSSSDATTANGGAGNHSHAGRAPVGECFPFHSESECFAQSVNLPRARTNHLGGTICLGSSQTVGARPCVVNA